MSQFTVPTREEVSAANQLIFDKLNTALGFVPNLYAAMAYSDTALGDYLQFQNIKTLFSKKEKEAINLAVSEINGCQYCQSAHTLLGKMNGFSDDQILSIRQGESNWDPKLDALVKLTQKIVAGRGVKAEVELTAFFNAGYTKAHLVDLILAIGDKTVMNLLHNITEIPIDFPIAPELERIVRWFPKVGIQRKMICDDLHDIYPARFINLVKMKEVL